AFTAKLVIAARCKIYSSKSGNICRRKRNHLQKDQCQYWHQLPQEWQLIAAFSGAIHHGMRRHQHSRSPS
ncbi:MAG: hypothetical protein ACK53Y_17865, partial [bacterium]